MTPEPILKIRQWIEVCDKSGAEIPEQVRLLDAYTIILEARILHLLEGRP